MSFTKTPIRTSSAFTLAALALVVTACASGPNNSDDPVNSSTAFPVTVTNCSNEITFDSAPERVIVLRNEVIPVFSSLGVLDRVVGLVGKFHEDYFDASTLDQFHKIPVLSDKISNVGGGEISIENVLAENPDLVIGTSSTITREALLSHGIAVLENEESCSGSQATGSLEDIEKLYQLYGSVFDRKAEATTALNQLDKQIQELKSRVSSSEVKTAAMLYPSIGGGAIYAYGADSMNHTLLELAGFKNVFADVPGRTFEVSIEELLDRNPDTLVLLHSGVDLKQLEQSITELPGASELNSVKNQKLMPLLFGFSSPASPITVKGLGYLVEFSEN